MSLSQRMHNVIWGPWIEDPIERQEIEHQWLRDVCRLEAINTELLEACRTAFDYLADAYEDSEAFKISQVLEQAICNAEEQA